MPNPTKPIPCSAPRPNGFHQLSCLRALLLDTGVGIDGALSVREEDIDFDNLLADHNQGKGQPDPGGAVLAPASEDPVPARSGPWSPTALFVP
jgi:hypothetical protein